MLLSLLQKRRSIRKFTDKKVETEKIDALIEAALRAPSGRGIYPWEFVVVTDEAVLEKLSLAKDKGGAFIKNAPLGVVVCADPDKTDIWIEDASIASIIAPYRGSFRPGPTRFSYLSISACGACIGQCTV